MKQGLKPTQNLVLEKVEEHIASAPQPIQNAADFGRKIAITRKSKKMTQQELADLASVGRRFLSELENGKETLEFGKALQVARAAGFDFYIGRR